ncbi:unnamed protein product [Moneuplotes crassus]|uniref:Uncharacterized protein n=1 Tax=Euplotes crassus TaxID=5936 RepID=A0AAD2D3U2_EUPCR|nr:unnamed protein product [Moneuplotes crassus]
MKYQYGHSRKQNYEVHLAKRESYFAENMIKNTTVYTLFWFESLKIQLNDFEVVYKNAAYCRCKKIYRIPKENQYNIYMSKHKNDCALNYAKLMNQLEGADINCLMLVKYYEPKCNDFNKIMLSSVKLMNNSLNILCIEKFFVKKRQFNLIFANIHQVKYMAFSRCYIEFEPRKISTKADSRLSRFTLDHVKNVGEDSEFVTTKPISSLCKVIGGCSLAKSLRQFRIFPGPDTKEIKEIRKESNLLYVEFITKEEKLPEWY